MAQAAHSGIVDLTGEDDSEDSIARANDACEKAFAAACRLTNHFESMKKPDPSKNPNERVNLVENTQFPAIVPKPLIQPRIGTSPNPARFETNGLKRDEKNNAMTRTDMAVPSPGGMPRPALEITPSRPAKSPSALDKAAGNKQQPTETKSVTPGADTSTIRTPRSAAVSAKQNIAETCNELEEWVNMDPNLIPQQAGVSTPRKPGRPRKDADEWSPSPNTKNNVEERKGLGRIITYSPTPSAGKHGDLPANEGNSLSSIKEKSTSLGIKKRKHSGSSQSRDSPVKLARWNEEPSAHRDSTPSNSAEPANRMHVQDTTGNSSPAGCFPRCVYPAIKAAKAEYSQSHTEDELIGIGKSITNDIVEQGVEKFCPASAYCPQHQRTELILKTVSKTFHERALKVRSGSPANLVASAEYPPEDVTARLFKGGLKASQLESDASTNSIAMMNNESLSKPSTAETGKNGASSNQADARPIRQTKPPMLHKQERIDLRLQQGFLEASDPTTSELGQSSVSAGHVAYTALFESVVYPAIRKSKRRHKDKLPWEELDAIGKTIVNDVLKKLASHPEDPHRLDDDTKKKIKHFVRKSFRQKARKATALSSHNPATAANGSRLDAATLSSDSSGVEDTNGGHRPRVSGLNHSDNSSSNRTITVHKKDQTPRQASPLDQQQPPSLKSSPIESPTSPFGPDFDRGRYPALRRRRGNKFFTPARTSKTNPKVEPIHSTPSDDEFRRRPTTRVPTDSTLTASASNHSSNSLGISNGKNQVRLLKAIANQPTIPRRSEMQLTASSTAAEKRRTPTNQKSALELLASIEEPTTTGSGALASAVDDDVSKALGEAPVQDKGRMMDVEETSADGLGAPLPHFGKSRNHTATNQLAKRIPGKSTLESSGPPKEPRPIFRPKPATALDPNFEHAVAVLVTDTSSGPSKDGQRYFITSINRMQLAADHSIIKHADSTSKVGKPKFVRIETKVIDPVRHPGSCMSSLLRNRELGLSSRGRHGGTMGELRQLKSETIEPWKNWKGASGDVVAVAWNPDSNVYAFGAAAHTNMEDIQYNRPCNLLLGNLTSNQIRELPDHRVDRPKPETIRNGPNATQAVYDACDPKVYETVTSIAFSPTGDRMFTASHDCTVKIWDVSAGKYQCLSTLRHEAWVTSVEISEHQQGLFATASKCVKDAVRVYYDSAEPFHHVTFSASRAEARPDWKIYPECLRWGPSPYNNHLLLAGFQQWEQQGDLLSGGGQLCLWDANVLESIKVTPSSQSVYAAAWHPTQPFFATGGAPGNNVMDKINTKTVVRTWDVRNSKRYQVEYECPAIDMQDITFAPLNSNIVTAGCTDGISYVWDWRWPDQPLHRLKHGRPLVDLDHTREREEADTGVMLSLWGPGGSLFYTGSSDGMIKAWDVRRHPKDVLIKNVANFDVSIQSGAFSPDGNNLLVGDAEGGIHVLSSAPCGPRSNVKSTDAYIDLVRDSDGSGLKLDQHDDNPGTEGIEAARSLVESGQLEYHQELGVGQGPNYQGPYATYARKEAVESPIGRLRKKFEKRQPISKRGEKRWDIAIPMTSLLCERKETLDHEKDGDNKGLDDPNEHEAKASQRVKATSRLEGAFAVRHQSSTSVVDPLPIEGVGATVADGNEDHVEDNTISESEMVEENYWWVRMGEEEIDQARAGRLRY